MKKSNILDMTNSLDRNYLLKIKCILMIAAFLFSQNAVATTFQKCTNIKDDSARLRCYDFASGRQPKDSEQKGNWQLTASNNPLDDTTTTVVMLESSQGLSRWKQKPVLIVRCKSNKTESYVSWHDFLGNDGGIYRKFKNVTSRIDSSQSIANKWPLSTDSKATFISNPIKFLRKIHLAKRLVLQTTPYGESPITVIFDLGGANVALKKIAKACNWDLTP